jgi:methionyl-tRNA formyltransferase
MEQDSHFVISLDFELTWGVHAGITPRYRGTHGGYWVLLNNDPGHCGVTIHLVDPGIDTGSIVARR